MWSQTIFRRLNKKSRQHASPITGDRREAILPMLLLAFTMTGKHELLYALSSYSQQVTLTEASHGDSRKMKEVASSKFFLATARALCAESPPTYTENSQAWLCRLNVLNHSNLLQCFKFAI